MNRQKNVSLSKYGINKSKIFYQLSSDELQKVTLDNNHGVQVSSGALAVNTGEFTGRSPKDRFIVKDGITKDKVWWGDINIPFEPSKFDKLLNRVIEYLDGKDLYVRDCHACAKEDHKLNIRVINEYPWSNMFAYNMFLRPSNKELEKFKPEWTVINAPGFLADKNIDGTRQHNFSILNFSKKIALIGGTGYTGEIKKGIFSALNFILPVYKNILPMHCSANIGINKETAIFFGLSGTGKTTLSTDSKRKLIGDDEHGWTINHSIFNFEGGCYAKVINLKREDEPEIYGAIKKGALLENVIVDSEDKVSFEDDSLTQNTRVSYPINHISNIQNPSIGENPKHIFFLTADAFGVLPPISKLTPSQAAYHFISGYTAKVAGTEAGVKVPTPSFSACFGAPFMPLHPSYYAELLIKKMNEAKVNVWLVNTGWTGGPYGIGSRIKLSYTRTIINAALDGSLPRFNYEDYHIHSVFGLAQPRKCPGIPAKVLSPRATWGNDKKYYETAFKLSKAFRNNFKKFEGKSSEEILRGGPQRTTHN
jgi:phosphoenolpyruvate carboxykinase (ATP)